MHHLLVAAVVANLGLGLSASAGAAPDGSQEILTRASSDGPIDEFILARAAAEVCRDRNLTVEESRAFLKSLSLRDPQYRSPEALKTYADKTLQKFVVAVEARGCRDPRVLSALSDWDFRVTLFAGIPMKEPMAQTATGDRR